MISSRLRRIAAAGSISLALNAPARSEDLAAALEICSTHRNPQAAISHTSQPSMVTPQAPSRYDPEFEAVCEGVEARKAAADASAAQAASQSDLQRLQSLIGN